MNIEEISIPVPWGHIAVKAWGDASHYPVLCVHGMQDNAASFDNLIPLLPSKFYYVAIDLPGHGFSSHLPPGLLLDWLNYLLTFQRIVAHFSWSKFIWIGHSIGGQLATYYCALYPEQIEKLVLLDALSPRKVKLEDTFDKVKDILDKQLILELKLQSSSQPVYSKEEVISKLKQRLLQNELSDAAAETLFTRAVTSCDQGYKFTFDQRLKNKLYLLLTEEQQHAIISNIKCQVLCILCQDSFDRVWIVKEDYIGTYYLYTQHPKFHIEMVDGNHDMQLTEPEKLAGFICDFLE